MLDNAWLSIPVDENIVFDMPYEDRWQAMWRHGSVSTSAASATLPGMPEPRLAAAGSAPRIVLAFDFGLRRIGVAVGNTLTGRARPGARHRGARP